MVQGKKTNKHIHRHTNKDRVWQSLISELSGWRGFSYQTLWLFIHSLLPTWGWWPLAAAPTQSITVHFQSIVSKSCRHVDPQLCDISHNMDFWLWNGKKLALFSFLSQFDKLLWISHIFMVFLLLNFQSEDA